MSCSRESGQLTKADIVSFQRHTYRQNSAYLEVNVLQPAHDDTVGRVLRKFNALPLLQALNVDHSAHELSVQGALVCKALNILGGVRVDLLERAGQFIIEPLNERDDAAGNLEELTLLDNRCLLIVLPFFSTLNDNNLLALLENLEELAELGVGTARCQYHQ